MEKERKETTERILKLTIEIIYLLTGEDYIVVKKVPDEEEAYSGEQLPITETLLHSLTQKGNCYQDIMALVDKITELLTGEVPVRCEDVTIYFSIEEWEYLKRHKNQYEDIIIKNHQETLIFSDESSKKETTKRYSSLLYSEDYPEENQNIPQNYQVTNLNDMKVEDIEEDETYVTVAELCKEEEIPTDISTDDCTNNLVGNNLLSPDYEVTYNKIAEDNREEHPRAFLTTNIPSDHHSRDPGIHKDPTSTQLQIVIQSTEDQGHKVFSCSECGKYFTKKSSLVMHEKIHRGERPFSCSECGKCFTKKSNLSAHERIHTGEKPFSCSECGKHFKRKSILSVHERIHTDVRPFSCSECGKQFKRKSSLHAHEKIHRDERPFSCTECGKCFRQKQDLIVHQRRHRGEKPFSCSECERGFQQRSELVIHQRIHTGEKPYFCSECGRHFAQKSALLRHRKIHTGENQFSSSECRKPFTQELDLFTPHKIHTEEKPFSCSECGKYFTRKSSLIKHLRTHTGEKLFPCAECGKCFSQKHDLVNHQVIHTGEKPFLCSECGQCFNHRSAVARHKKQIHFKVQTIENVLPQMEYSREIN